MTVSESAQPDRERALQCLSLAIAYEAGYEPLTGQQAVAEVILNRAKHPAYPKSICGVVFQGSQRKTGCQFTFTCDGAMNRQLPAAVMASARQVAESVLDGRVSSVAGGATHYHADYVSPYWAPSLFRIVKIGAHIFYRAPSAVDGRGRFALGTEPAITLPGALAGPPTGKESASLGQTAAPDRPATADVFRPWGLAVGSAPD